MVAIFPQVGIANNAGFKNNANILVAKKSLNKIFILFPDIVSVENHHSEKP